MKLIFCSSFFKNQQDVIDNSKIAPNISTHKFNHNLMEGLYANLGDDLIVINNEDYASYPNSKFFYIKKEKYNISKISVKTIRKINLPIIKYFFEYCAYINVIRETIRKYPNESISILCYGRYFPNVMAVNKMKKKFDSLKSCMVIADLSGDVACKTANYGKVRELANNYFVNKGLMLSKEFDCFVLISKHMADILNIQHKPYTVIEGIVTPKTLPTIKEKRKNIVLYSGIISEQYGVDKLVEAVSLTSNNVELHLYGDGPYKKKILKLCDERIKFFGYVNNETILRKEVEATLLINPRQNIERYTMYSMPSKNIEYLLSGKPVICYKLGGIPDEYDEYFHYIEGNDPNDIAKKIDEVLSYGASELEFIGKRNRDFVITKKSSKEQTRKILDLLSSVNERKKT